MEILVLGQVILKNTRFERFFSPQKCNVVYYPTENSLVYFKTISQVYTFVRTHQNVYIKHA